MAGWFTAGVLVLAAAFGAHHALASGSGSAPAGPAAVTSPNDTGNVSEQVGDQNGPDGTQEVGDSENANGENADGEQADGESDQDNQTALTAQAKITADQAVAAVLAAYPGATVGTPSLEDVDGSAAYGMTVTANGRTLDVKVDAQTGKVIQADLGDADQAGDQSGANDQSGSEDQGGGE